MVITGKEAQLENASKIIMLDKRDVACIDLFCGAGGLTHGFVREGVPVVAGVDLDPACKFPYETNNRGAKFLERDISQLSHKELSTYFGNSKIKILAGCAPCQPFSTYAQRYDIERDGKWSLLHEFARLVKEIKPTIVTMENVPSLDKHEVFMDFVATLEDLGYEVSHGVVDSARYGVPQSRRRLVLLASVLGPIKLTPPTRRKPKTVGQVIGHLPPIKAGESYSKDRLHTSSKLSKKNLERIKYSKPGGTWRDWPEHLVADCHKAETGKTFPGVYGRMKWDAPAPTMTTQCYGFGNGRFGHPKQNRAISLREAALLQSFPREYAFIPDDGEVAFKTLGRLIGNAVPVDLGRAIARSIVKHLDEVAERRK